MLWLRFVYKKVISDGKILACVVMLGITMLVVCLIITRLSGICVVVLLDVVVCVRVVLCNCIVKCGCVVERVCIIKCVCTI